MQKLLHPLGDRPFADWPLAVKSILGFWLFYAVTVIARAFLNRDPVTVLQNRSLTVVVGILLTFGIYTTVTLIARRSGLRRRAVVAGVASVVAAALMSGILMFADRYQDKPQDQVRFISAEGYRITETGHATLIERDDAPPITVTWPRVAQLDPYLQFRIGADSMVVWLFFFVAWSAFYTAIVAQSEAHGARRRAADAEAAAHAAQVRALRYQVNPHFLFNTLNSLSSLVMTGRTDRAEAMLLALSTFFRSSLSLDPSDDVTLAQEIDLQRLYLDIEKARFPDRLQVEIDVPEDLKSARLPALILQPIVENAIKYGVSATRQKVVINISAERRPDGRMNVTVVNRLLKRGKTELPAASHEGTGVGLANVCQRLEARFGSKAECRYGPVTGGGYKVTLTMPIQDND